MTVVLGGRTAELMTLHAGGAIEFRIQRALRTPNEFLGMHWREKSRERKRWQACLLNAVVAAVGVAHTQRLLKVNDVLPGCTGGCLERRRVTVTRQAPSRRRFIRDDDNLRFAVKPLLDGLKHLGLIRDDHRKWIDLPSPTQDVSADGTFWTVIRLEAAADAR